MSQCPDACLRILTLKNINPEETSVKSPQVNPHIRDKLPLQRFSDAVGLSHHLEFVTPILPRESVALANSLDAINPHRFPDG
jgi:hypothetical protein